MSRFTVLALVTLLVACSDSNNSYVAEAPLVPLGLAVETMDGPVEGIESERALSWEYLGIPFAAPPVGDLRWRSPQPVSPWTEPLIAAALPDFCPQFLYFSDEFAGSEDCLYLNVFRPQSQDRDLPVFVWIHGGGNNNGDTGQETPAYNGARLAERGNMVVVTVQYRLSAMGWLYHPSLQPGDPLDDSGNYGTLDLMSALQWVQANAAVFGGDAANVTIAGESAGAANVLTLMVSDEANGLYHKGIIQSLGGSITPTAVAEAQSNALLESLQDFAGMPGAPMTDEETADFLRGFDAETILTLADTSEIIGDGNVIPASDFDSVLEAGDFPGKVPLLFGTNRDEYKLYTNPLGFNEYPDGPPELQEAVGRYLSDAWRVTGADDLATTLRAVADMPELYVYRFAWGSPDENGDSALPGNFGETGGAFHSSEISFMMGNEDIFIFPDFTPFFYTEGNAASRATMADIMVSYWSSFAWMSDPNGNSLPTWEPWTNSGDFKAVTLDVSNADDSVKVEPDPTVLTQEAVYASANANLEGEILDEVIRRLNTWFGVF